MSNPNYYQNAGYFENVQQPQQNIQQRNQQQQQQQQYARQQRNQEYDQPNYFNYQNQYNDQTAQQSQDPSRLTIIREKIVVKPSLISQNFILFASEFVGTLLLILLTCMGCTINPNDITLLSLSIANGLIVMAIIHVLGPISGAHINPAVTISYWIVKRESPFKIGIYIIAQLLGSITGWGLLRLITPSHHFNDVGVCMTIPNLDLSSGTAVVVEAILTFVLVSAVCMSWDKKQENCQDSIALRIGLLITMLSLVGGGYTGASMNPVRSFGPAIFQASDFLWVYWVGPISGSLIASLFYLYVLAKKKDD